MGKVEIRYYVTRQRNGCPKWGYWAPCLARRSKISGKIEPTLMAKLGFKHVDCGADGPRAWSIAEGWNARWDQSYADWLQGDRSEETGAVPLDRVFPRDSLGEAFAKYRRTATWAQKALTTRDDWWRGWKYIEPVFGDVDPATVTFQDMDLWYGGDPKNPEVKGLKVLIGVRESHRAMKIWRALWKVAGSLNKADGGRYCVADEDPSLAVRRENPKARSAVWLYHEAMPLIEASWENGFKGLAAALGVAWDTMLSPVDVRKVSLAMLVQSTEGPFFDLDRTKTRKAAIGTLSDKTARLLEAYIASLPFTLHPDTPIFHTRGGQPGPKGGRPRPPVPYTKNKLGKDFRIIRELLYPGETRMISDFRRSGALEAKAGKVDLAHLSDKMANSIDKNKALQDAYLPGHASLVREADDARERGRVVLLRGRKRNGVESPEPPESDRPKKGDVSG